LRISIVRPQEPAEPVDLCVVVDVLRATTTAAVLCHRLDELYVLRTPTDLEHLPAREAGYALFSELPGIEVGMARYDNSPVLARDAAIDGRVPVLVTTNGTIAVGLAARFARDIILAGFVNLSAVVDYVRRQQVATLSIMPAGNITSAKICVEDDGCARSIAGRLAEDGTLDIAAVIADCLGNPRILARRANEPNLGPDIDLCFAVDAVPVVPRVVVDAAQPWFLVERAPS
jgi:2-phosphosulfolactate phosphatase